MMSREALSRRRFLKLIGATALTAPFVRALPSYAGPSGGGNPVFLVPLFTANGCVRYRWGAQGPNPGSVTATTVTAGPLQFRQTLGGFTTAGPFGSTSGTTDLTSYITVLDGLHNEAAGTGTHEAGMATLWTGLSNAAGNQATGPSIDQVIARLLASQLNINKPYANIPFYAMSSQDYQQRSVDTRMLYDASGNYVDPLSNPATALTMLFPNAVAATTKDNTAAIRSAVLKQVNTDLSAMQGKLCREDKQQLQTLQALYNQAAMQIENAAAAASSCKVPDLGAAPGTGDPFVYNIAAMGTLLAMALACDLTRVASFQLSHALSPVTHSWLGSSQQQTHHIYSHQGPSSLWSLGANLYGTSSSVTGQSFASMYPQQLVDIETFYAQQIASFAYTLSQLAPVGGGSASIKSLLDQCLVCWGSELDMGASHSHDDTPFVLIGGASGAIKTNQLVTFPLNLANNAANNPPTNNRFHNDLLLTLAQVMGVELPGNTFGTSSLCTTPIMEILA
jgi:hypothetical protein